MVNFYGFHVGKYMDVEPKIGVVNPPKCMVKIMEHPMNKSIIWWFSHYFWFNTHIADRVSVWDPNSFQMMVTGDWWATGGCPSELTKLPCQAHTYPLNIGPYPKGSIPTIHFQVLLLLVSGTVDDLENDGMMEAFSSFLLRISH